MLYVYFALFNATLAIVEALKRPARIANTHAEFASYALDANTGALEILLKYNIQTRTRALAKMLQEMGCLSIFCEPFDARRKGRVAVVYSRIRALAEKGRHYDEYGTPED